MEILIVIFGALIVLAGIAMILKPDFIFDYLKRESGNYKLHMFAIAIRLILGVLLIYYANLSDYPVTMEALGWFTVIAAVALILIGHNNFRDLIEWAVTFLRPYRYLAGILAIILGGFLIFAFL